MKTCQIAFCKESMNSVEPTGPADLFETQLNKEIVLFRQVFHLLFDRLFPWLKQRQARPKVKYPKYYKNLKELVLFFGIW